MTKERFVEQIELLQGRLYRVALCMLKNDADVQDALQETVLKAWEKRHTLRNEAYFGTWVTRIVINTCKDMLRGSWFRHVDRNAVLEDLPLPVSPPSVEHIALTSAIMALPRKYMEVILLHCDQGMNIRETAQALGITPPAVINRLKKARNELRIALEGGADE